MDVEYLVKRYSDWIFYRINSIMPNFTEQYCFKGNY